MHGIFNFLAFPATSDVDFEIFEPPVDRLPGGRDRPFSFWGSSSCIALSYTSTHRSFSFRGHSKTNSREKNTKVPLESHVNIDHPGWSILTTHRIRETQVEEQSEQGSVVWHNEATVRPE
jgi:hypothetical protein